MNAWKIVILLACAAGNAAAQGGPRPTFMNAYWLKEYSLSPYREYWTVEAELKNYDRDLPAAIEAVSKNGGRFTQPVESFASSRESKTQQLSLAISREGAKKLLKVLRKLGTAPDPRVRMEMNQIPAKEVKEKSDRLIKEKTEHAAELARLPAAASLLEETLERLMFYEELAKKTDSEVLFNLTVRGRP
jgi:hypothetical protein